MAKKTEYKFVLRGENKTAKAFKGVEQGLQRTQQGISSLRSAAVGLFAALSAGAFASFVKSSLDAGDALAKTSAKLGVATEALAGLRYAAELSGVSTQTMDMALQRMTRRLSEAAQGTGEARDAIKELGLDAGRLASLSPDNAFREIAGAMGEVGSQSDRVRLAFKLFDSEGVALVNTLALGADGLAQAQIEAEAFGLALSAVDVAKMESANDQMTRARSIASGLGRSIATEVAPYIDAMADYFVNAAKEAGGMSNYVSGAMQNVVGAVGFVADAFRGLEVVWAALKVGFGGMVWFVLDGLASLDRQLADIIDSIPGLSYTPSADLQAWAEGAGMMLNNLRQELADLANAPMPSTAVKQWSSDVQAYAQQAAEAVAATRRGILSGGGAPAAGAAPGGGTTGSADKQDAALARQIDRLTESLMTEEQRIAESYERRTFMVEDAFQQQIISEQRKNELIEQINAEHNAKISEMTRSTAINWVDIWSSAGNRFAAGIGDAVASAIVDQQNMADAMRSVLRSVLRQVISTLVEIGVKKLALAVFDKASIAATTAATVASGATIATAMAPAAAATSLAMAGANAAPASAGITATFALTEALALAGIAHDGLDYVPREATYLLDKGEMVLNKGNADAMRGILASGVAKQPVTVNLNMSVTANDTQGFDELLVKRSDMIAAMAVRGVREAMEQRGQRSVV